MEESLENLAASISAAPLKLAQALLEAQAEFTAVIKDASNPAFKRGDVVSKYATLDSVISATRPALIKHKLLVMQDVFRPELKTEVVSQEVGVRTTLLHTVSGESWVSEMTAPGGNRNDFNIQTIGAVITYLRRYGLVAMLGLAPEDEDGNPAAGRTESVQPNAGNSRRGPEPTTSLIPPAARAKLASFPTTTSNIPTAAIAGDLAHATTSAAPATLPKPEIVATPVESTSTPNPDAVPDSREYNDYAISAMAVLEQLQKEGLTGSATAAKNKFKKYLCKVGSVDDTKSLTHGLWSLIFTQFAESALRPGGMKTLVADVESAAKEAK